MPRHGSSFVLLGLAALAACATDSERQVSRTLDQYIGLSEAAAVINFGAPVNRTMPVDGPHSVTFVVSGTMEGGGYHAPVPRSETVHGTSYGRRGLRTYTETRTTYADGPWMPETTIPVECTIVFQVDAAGIITSYSYDDGSGTSPGYLCSQALARRD